MAVTDILSVVMETIARQFEAWYAARREFVATVSLDLGFESKNPDSPGGEAALSIETSAVIATVFIWNNGLVDVHRIAKMSGKGLVYDHREMAPDEDLAELLDRYIQQITTDPG